MRMTPFEEFDRIFERMFHGTAGPRPNPPAWYGCHAAVGPDGVPRVREFGNAPRQVGTGSAGNLAVDVIDDEKSGSLKLVAEIPGVEKDDIDVSLEENSVSIRASRGDTEYEGRVPVRDGMDRDSVRAAYRNGILEVTVPVEDGPRGRTVRVE